jgi:nucleolar GTP-binding protein
VPLVAPAAETLGSALKRAARLTATTGMAPEASEAARARKRSAQQLDALTKALSNPLAIYVDGFPEPRRLHPFERALLDLTVGTREYERALLRVDALRKGTLELGKGHAGFANRAVTAQEAEQRRRTGFQGAQPPLALSQASHARAEMEALFRRGSPPVDELKEIAKSLRALPVAELRSPTAALVGAPNVGKSSLIRLLSSGTPTVANYPFTTRSVAMGHLVLPPTAAEAAAGGREAQPRRCVLTDTPGVLLRPDESRNRMERLTLAVLAFLPCAVVFVLDASGGCGTSVAGQLAIRRELKSRFPGRPWLDVLSKCDLQPHSAGEGAEAAEALGGGALRVSVTTGEGTAELSDRLQALLRQAAASAELTRREGRASEETAALTPRVAV